MNTKGSLKLTAEGAEKILQAAAGKVKEMGIPLSVTIVDGGTRADAAAGPNLYVTFPGGLPIEVDGHCVGGIRVSGGTSQQDVEVARAGLAALTG